MFRQKFCFTVTVIFLLMSCADKKKYYKLDGTTMGTYFAITYEGSNPQKMLDDINNILEEYNDVLSAYIPTSTIRNINDGNRDIFLNETEKKYFAPVIEASERLKKSTDSALNPAISPVVNYWGFGYTGVKKDEFVDTSLILELVGLSKVSKFDLDGDTLRKSPSNAQIDYSSLAKGYGIDVIAEFFDDRGVENYLIDIGGEAKGQGKNAQGESWRLAINKPLDDSKIDEMEMVISLKNNAIATSGNYRQYYIKDGKKFAHIIDPKTGFPALSNLLSATILSDRCMDADGLATALCVMGMDKAKSFLQRNTEVKACLIYDLDGDDQLEKFYANGFEEYIVVSK